jgi:hypothetical protein
MKVKIPDATCEFTTFSSVISDGFGGLVANAKVVVDGRRYTQHALAELEILLTILCANAVVSYPLFRAFIKRFASKFGGSTMDPSHGPGASGKDNSRRHYNRSIGSARSKPIKLDAWRTLGSEADLCSREEGFPTKTREEREMPK